MIAWSPLGAGRSRRCPEALNSRDKTHPRWHPRRHPRAERIIPKSRDFH